VNEKELQKSISRALLKMPDVAFHTINTSGKVRNRHGWITIGKWFANKNSHNGLSDITGMKIDGIFFAIEVKVFGFKVKEEQEGFLEYVKTHGGLSGYATSILDAETIIRGFEICI